MPEQRQELRQVRQRDPCPQRGRNQPDSAGTGTQLDDPWVLQPQAISQIFPWKSRHAGGAYLRERRHQRIRRQEPQQHDARVPDLRAGGPAEALRQV